MGYRLIAEAAMLLHFAFLCYVVFGGFLAWWRAAAFWPHLGFAAYALGIVTIEWPCPLTALEDWGRTRAGQEGLPTGFIDHYLTGVIYPEEHVLTARFVMAGVVGASWAGAAVLAARRRAAAGPPTPRAGVNKP
ncbi:DUF2784 domain-containing protein [Nocardiopsis trehalosi]|jgi:hypothetical protein|uniref:DUF2784 domain-containing protein n=1 Tax=Nocardiopsis trehalosi TaxID=109329 RepID=UPI00082A3402|nr:DUF2784 domain-containing protein [Nocardiopsis trehalosi]